MSQSKDIHPSGINLGDKKELFEIHNFVKVYVKHPQQGSFVVRQHNADPNR
jgi:hypothetical protein